MTHSGPVTKSPGQLKRSPSPASAPLPRCLVLLASYNGAQYIRQQLESILAQQGVLVEIDVADDSSTDNTAEVATGFEVTRRVRVLRRPVGTGSAAQNFISLIQEVDAASYDYVALSDHDDIWMPEKLERATHLLSVTGAGGYSSSVIARWPDGSESVLRQSAKVREADFLFEGAGQGCTFVLTRSFFEQTQQIFRNRRELMPRLIYHDWAIYAIARSLHVQWTFDDEPSIWYRQHSSNDTGARASIAGVRRRLALLSTGQYRRQISALSDLCSELAPSARALLLWKEIEKIPTEIRKRSRKASFCFRHGRRRGLDRTLTTLAAICGWV